MQGKGRGTLICAPAVHSGTMKPPQEQSAGPFHWPTDPLTRELQEQQDRLSLFAALWVTLHIMHGAWGRRGGGYGGEEEVGDEGTLICAPTVDFGTMKPPQKQSTGALTMNRDYGRPGLNQSS